MNVKDALDVIDAGWVRKTGGYRVRYQHWQDGQLVTAYSPELEGEAALKSEVAARRLAWKLWQATREADEDELFNLVVVDDLSEPVKSYVTGDIEVFNPRKVEEPSDEPKAESPIPGDTPA